MKLQAWVAYIRNSRFVRLYVICSDKFSIKLSYIFRFCAESVRKTCEAMQVKVVALLITLLYWKEANSQCNNTNPCPLKGGEPLRFPQEYKSVDGFLDLTLTAEIAELQFDWLTVKRRTYNGMAPGPTWRIKAGDKVNVTFNNTLQYPQLDGEMNAYQHPNSTNIHTHGLHISSMQPQDDVFTRIDPNTTYKYQYDVVSSNSPGTYWYHAHLHGSVQFQVQSGMGGIIIIDDETTGPYAPPAHLQAVSCPDNCQHEVPIIFQSLLLYADGGFGSLQKSMGDYVGFRDLEYIPSLNQTLSVWLDNTSNSVNYFTANGQLFPRLDIVTGQTKRFRLVNGGSEEILELVITDQGTETATTGCTVREIAYDGIYLNETRPPRFNKSLLAPAVKVDWLVVCNNPGVYELRSVLAEEETASLGRFGRHAGLLMTIHATGSITSTTIPTSLPPRVPIDSDFLHLNQNEVSGRFVIEVSSGIRLNREHLKDEFYYRFKTELNTVQEWYLINADPNLGHPIHIHVNNFQIISYNDYTGPVSASHNGNLVFFTQEGEKCYYQSSTYNASGTTVDPPTRPYKYGNHSQRWRDEFYTNPATIGYVAKGEFRDIIIVPPLVNITIRFVNDMFTGTITIHCHILGHEDFGMMMTTEVYESGGPSSDAYNRSGGAAPGQCKKCDPFPFNEDMSSCDPDSTPPPVPPPVPTPTPIPAPIIYLLLLLLLIPIIIAVVVYCMLKKLSPCCSGEVQAPAEQAQYTAGTTSSSL